MIRPKTPCRSVLWLAGSLLLSLTITADAWAKKADEAASGSGGRSFVLAYILVGFLVLLGVLAASRPAKRESGIDDARGKARLPALLSRKKKNAKSGS